MDGPGLRTLAIARDLALDVVERSAEVRTRAHRAGWRGVVAGCCVTTSTAQIGDCPSLAHSGGNGPAVKLVGKCHDRSE